MFKILVNYIIKGWVEATAFITTGGTSSQFVKGDGSLDGTTYAVDADVLHKTGDETKTGKLTIDDDFKVTGEGVINSLLSLKFQHTVPHYPSSHPDGILIKTNILDTTSTMVYLKIEGYGYTGGNNFFTLFGAYNYTTTDDFIGLQNSALGVKINVKIFRYQGVICFYIDRNQYGTFSNFFFSLGTAQVGSKNKITYINNEPFPTTGVTKLHDVSPNFRTWSNKDFNIADYATESWVNTNFLSNVNNAWIDDREGSNRLYLGTSSNVSNGFIYRQSNDTATIQFRDSANKKIVEWDGQGVLIGGDVPWGRLTGVPNFDNYQSWNLKTNGVQRTTVQSGGTLDLVAGNNTSLQYGAGGKVTINSSFNDTTYTAGAGLDLTGTEFSINSATQTKINHGETAYGYGLNDILINGGSSGNSIELVSLPLKMTSNKTSGGWATPGLEQYNTEATGGEKFVIKTFGSGNTYNYTYLGYGNYNGLNNLRLYPNGDAKIGNDEIATQLWVGQQGYLTSETDPIFTASPAFGITTGNISNWNGKENAFSKNTAFNKNFGTTAGTVAEGNHTHPASDITSGTFPYSRLPISAAQVSNWNAAYTHSNITSGNPHGVSYGNILGTPPTQSTPTLQEVLEAGSTGTISNDPIVLATERGDIDIRGDILSIVSGTGIKINDGNSIGTAGQVLTSNGTYAKWEDPSYEEIGTALAVLPDSNNAQFTLVAIKKVGNRIVIKGEIQTKASMVSNRIATIGATNYRPNTERFAQAYKHISGTEYEVVTINIQPTGEIFLYSDPSSQPSSTYKIDIELIQDIGTI